MNAIKISLILAVLILAIGDASAQNTARHGVHPVYGEVPYGNGAFYARYPTYTFNLQHPVYHTNPAGLSYSYGYPGYWNNAWSPYSSAGIYGYGSYGYSHPMISYAGVTANTAYARYPAYWYGQGYYGSSYASAVHGYHRPVLYPGIYRVYRV